jgi:hypothetical protein
MTTHTLNAWPPKADSARFFTRQFADDPADLNIDFDAPRTNLVSHLLANCLYHADGLVLDADTPWDWTVSERLQGLLAIANTALGESTAAIATCSNTACAGQVEIELGLPGFAVNNPNNIEWVSPNGKSFSCRVPTGSDQRAWLAHTNAHGDIDSTWLANRLLTAINNTNDAGDLIESMKSTDFIGSLGTALAAADPLTALTLDVSCPFCEQSLCVDIDLEHLLLEGLRLKQRRLMNQVHRLASHYHWTETDIAALPAWRRERYLANITAEFE